MVGELARLQTVAELTGVLAFPGPAGSLASPARRGYGIETGSKKSAALDSFHGETS